MATLEEWLAIWDLIEDKTIVYVPIWIIEEKKTKQLFYETFTNSAQQPYIVARAFITLPEAEEYVKSMGDKQIGLAKISIDRLYKSFENFFGKKNYSKAFECVLCLVEEHKLKEVDVLWTNMLNG